MTTTNPTTGRVGDFDLIERLGQWPGDMAGGDAIVTDFGLHCLTTVEDLQRRYRSPRDVVSGYLAKFSHINPATLGEHLAGEKAPLARLLAYGYWCVLHAHCSPVAIRSLRDSKGHPRPQFPDGVPDGARVEVEADGYVARLKARQTERLFPTLDLTAPPTAIPWLAEGILVRGQGGAIVAPPKTLKTSLMMDLAVSVATGTPFLGCYPVPEPATVLFYSGESGNWTLCDMAARICKARGIEVPADRLHVVPRTPTVNDLTMVEAKVRAVRADVVFIDPLYKALAGERLVELPVAGQLLTRIEDACRNGNPDAAPLFAHHAKKSTGAGPLTLDDASGVGIPEYARCWLLVNRRGTYKNDGVHNLIVSGGGSIGYAVRFDLKVEEGTQPNRYWRTAVTEPRAEAPANAAAGSKGKAPAKGKDVGKEMLSAIKASVAPGERVPFGEMFGSWDGGKRKAASDALLARGVLQKKGRQYVYVGEPAA